MAPQSPPDLGGFCTEPLLTCHSTKLTTGNVPKEEVADYLVDYAKMFNAPIREGIDVRAVTRKANSSGFLVNTSEGVIETSYVISATGAFQRPMVPPIIPDIALIMYLLL